VSNKITITAGNFETEVLRSPLPVLLDFWAEWCGPCRMIAPFLEELAGEYAGRIKIGTVNVDEETSLAGQHGIVSIPTLVLYKDGVEVEKKPGAAPKHEIEAFFHDAL
jgi:thioredoxin 1